MYKVIIADDELASREILSDIVQKSELPIECAGQAHTIVQTVNLIHALSPDLLLLDIEFPEGLGFEVLESCKNLDFNVIFITAHEAHAITAIKHHALDYILKPIDAAEVKDALANACVQLDQRKTGNWSGLLSTLQGSMNQRFKIPISDGYRYIDLSKLIYLQADGNYTKLHLEQEDPILVSKKLAWFESRLMDRGFIRVHRSFLVNKDHIVEYHRSDGRYLVVSSGDRIGISKAVSL